jgi:hypothetical protein
MAKLSNVSATSFAQSSVNPLPKPLKCREAFEEHSLSWTAVFKCINVSRPVECQLKMTNIQGNQAPAK